MNLRKGFLRLWIVASAVWVGTVGYFAFENVIVPAKGYARLAMMQNACAVERRAKPELGNPFDCFTEPVTKLPGLNDGDPDDWIPADATGRPPGVWGYIVVAASFPLGMVVAWLAGRWIIFGFLE